MTLFRGATAVRGAVIDYLTVAVPMVVAQARTEWGLTEYQLPVPVGYDAYETPALDRWPYIGVNIALANTFTRVDVDDSGGYEYLSQYSVRVFTWIKTPVDEAGLPIEPEYSESLRLRDDLAACVRGALLLTGSLGQPAIIMDETTLTEDYSEATAVKGDRFVAGVVHAFTIRFDESVPLVSIGTANTISVIAQLLSQTETGS